MERMERMPFENPEGRPDFLCSLLAIIRWSLLAHLRLSVKIRKIREESRGNEVPAAGQKNNLAQRHIENRLVQFESKPDA